MMESIARRLRRYSEKCLRDRMDEDFADAVRYAAEYFERSCEIVDQFNKEYDTSTTVCSTTQTNQYSYCAYRLPCGICTRTNRQCPGAPNAFPVGPVYKLPDITCGEADYPVNLCGEIT